MPKFSKIHPVGHSAEQMFALVADVEQYPHFLPLCESLLVRSRRKRDGREILIAEMGVGYKAIHQRFATQVIMHEPGLVIDVKYLDGPFRRLDNQWRFEPTGPNACNVHFAIEYEFASRPLAMVMGSMFDYAFRRFTAAFEARAAEIYRPVDAP